MSYSFVRIATRNLRRNTRRTLITALSITIGTSMIILCRGILNGLHDAVIEGTTGARLGDLQLHHKDYLGAKESLPLQLDLSMDERVNAFLRTDPRIREASGRILFSGLISAGEDTSLYFGMGIDPEHEYNICNWLPGFILEGTTVKSSRPRSVVVGKPLADSLDLHVGSEITVLANTRYGTLNGMDFDVAGIIEYKFPGPGSRIIQMPLATAQKLLYLNDQVTEIILDVENLDEVNEIAETLDRHLNSDFSDLPLEVSTWQELGKMSVDFIAEQDAVLIYVVAVLYILMMSGITNTMMMSVFERNREIGTMMAIGVKRRRILLLFLEEAILLSSVGAIVGVTMGAICVKLLHATGLPLPPMGQATTWTDIYPRTTLEYSMAIVMIAMVVGILAALYPAYRAARLLPAEALSDH